MFTFYISLSSIKQINPHKTSIMTHKPFKYNPTSDLPTIHKTQISILPLPQPQQQSTHKSILSIPPTLPLHNTIPSMHQLPEIESIHLTLLTKTHYRNQSPNQ